jgi:hypothetical protein
MLERVNVLERRPVPKMSSVVPGAAVPMPTLPFWSTLNALEPTASPPKKVEVAVVEVAVR